MLDEVITLERPLVAIDLEATGVDPEEARIIQVAAQRYVPSEDGMRYDGGGAVVVDPGIPIPEHVQELTGISQKYVEREGDPWEEVAEELAELIYDADLVGYNIVGYDFPLLQAEYARLDVEVPGPEDRKVVDSYALEKQFNAHTLENVYAAYTGEDLENAHNAAADVDATLEVFQHQCSRFDLEGSTLAEIVDAQRGEYLDSGRKLKERDDGSIELAFGKYQGKTLEEVRENDRDYLNWVWDEIPQLKPFIKAAFSDE